MALWDLAGQAFDVPIWQLLGGKFRDSIRLYNDCHAGDVDTPSSWVEKAVEVEDRGFDAIKFDIDPRPSQRDAYNRGISNTDIAFLIDAHWRYSPVDILKVAYAFEDLNLLWLEDPIPPENVDAMAKITAATHLHGRDFLYPSRFSRFDPSARRRYCITRHGQSWGIARRATDC